MLWEVILFGERCCSGRVPRRCSGSDVVRAACSSGARCCSGSLLVRGARLFRELARQGRDVVRGACSPGSRESRSNVRKKLVSSARVHFEERVHFEKTFVRYRQLTHQSVVGSGQKSSVADQNYRMIVRIVVVVKNPIEFVPNPAKCRRILLGSYHDVLYQHVVIQEDHSYVLSRNEQENQLSFLGPKKDLRERESIQHQQHVESIQRPRTPGLVLLGGGGPCNPQPNSDCLSLFGGRMVLGDS